MRSSLTPVDEAIDFLIESARCLVKKETVPIASALGRILAIDVVSGINVPMLDNSAMDGYAINTASLTTGSVLVVSDRIPAGSTGQALRVGTAARIFTGAPVPVGTNAVVIQENTTLTDGNVCLNKIPLPGENIRKAGQDIRAGAMILAKGRRLKAQDLGLIVSVGFSEIVVFKKLKIAVMSTGDELVEPPGELAPGQIFNSNQHTLLAMIRQLGMEPVDLGLVADTVSATEAALLRGADLADCILSTGGVSVGEEDHVKSVVEKLGKLDLWRLAIKPGKPLAFGRIAGTPFFGLPGNPVSSFVTFTMIARPFFLKSQGASELKLNVVFGRANFSRRAEKRREYYRVRVQHDEFGQGVITNYENQGSGVMSSVSWATGLAELEIDRVIQPGDVIKVYVLP